MKLNAHIRFAGPLIIGSILAGCGKWPDVVTSRNDIMSLHQGVSSLRARGLSDDDIPYLERFGSLSYLDFRGGSAIEEALITDVGVRLLARAALPKLETLTLGYCRNLTDIGMSCLASNKTIKWLSIMGCQKITDEGLKSLTSMRQLQTLDMRGCRGITDAGLVHLQRMTNLCEVLLGGCVRITEAGVRDLQGKLPSCNVSKDEKEWLGHVNDYVGHP